MIASIHGPSCPGEYRTAGRGPGGYWTGCDCAATTATVEHVSPNPKRLLSADDEKRIRQALDARDNADENLRAVVVDASTRASVRVLAEFTGMSTNTISRWKADARD